MPVPPVVPRVPLVTRSEWGAVPARKSLSALGRATGVVVHHPAQGFSYASKPGVSESDGREALRALQAGHLQRGFSDTGYHFLIDGAGRIYQGREYVGAGQFAPGRTPPKLALGSHVGGKNTGRIGVCVLGCFGAHGEPDCGDTPSPAALAALDRLLTAICLGYGIAAASIVGHRDLAPTACPRDRLYPRLPDLRKSVAEAVRKAA